MKESEINRAQEKEPKSGHHAPARGGVGEERKYSGKAFGDTLGGAVKELHEQHPKKHDDLGPHHGGSRHDRHEPLHGLHPKSKHGR